MNLVSSTVQAQRSVANSFWMQLQPASFRGVPFGVQGGQARFGRRNAIHEYPYRDVPWVEDLGRQSRRIQITGFLVGDDVIDQRDRLVAACEKPGDGELIHPTFGRLSVALMEVSAAEHWEKGRVFEINFTFIEQGTRMFPGSSVSSSAAITSAASGVNAAATALWTSKFNALSVAGVITAPSVLATVQGWVSKATGAVRSATSLMNLAATLPGSFGRLLAQESGIPFSGVAIAATSIQALIGSAAGARASVSIVATSLATAAQTIQPSSAIAFVALAQQFAAVAKLATFTPADAIRSTSAMMAPGILADATSLATSDMLRRLALASLATASADYQPSTSSEAAGVRTQVLTLLDAEVLTAGNQGDDSVYTALRALRAEVIRDMNAKGANLPALVTITTPNSMPSLPLAQKLYRDPGRDDELVRRANPIHPAFMPVSFVALNK